MLSRRAIACATVSRGCALSSVALTLVAGWFITSPVLAGISTARQDAFPGYTLISPLQDVHTYLVDMDGKVVHSWKHDLRPGLSVYLMDDGSLLRCARTRDGAFRGNGAGGHVQRFAWDGELLWDYRMADDKVQQHHDIAPLPGGNILVIAWEAKTAEEAIAAGRDPGIVETSGILWSGALFEVRPASPTAGEIVWEWHAWDHRTQDRDPGLRRFGELASSPGRIDINGDLGREVDEEASAEVSEVEAQMRALGYAGDDEDDESPGEKSVSDDHRRHRDWLHINAVNYSEETDLILLSSRKLSEAWIIDHSTTTREAAGSSGGAHGKGGELLYRWGNAAAYGHGGPADQRLFGQHDPRWIDSGKAFTVFNNGLGRTPPYSSIDEIELPIGTDGKLALGTSLPHGPDEARWSYGDFESEHFYASFISGAERLPNGNTLVCDGPAGHVFEVARDGERVWEYTHRRSDGPTPAQQGARHTQETTHAGDGPHEEPAERMPRRRPPRDRRNVPASLFRATRVPLNHPGLPEDL